MTRLATAARTLEAAMRDITETEELAVAAWRAVDRLSLCPVGCLAMNRTALIEMRERIDGMLELKGRGDA